MPSTEPRRSIGQVLALLKPDFPDVSISKIRFLEAEGLLNPERAPSGYRRYAPEDVERLRYVLSMQQTHYLPLKVIRDHLAEMDRGATPAAPQVQRPTATAEQVEQATRPRAVIRMTRDELLQASGLTDDALADLERVGVVAPRSGTSSYGRDQLTVATAARRLADFGIDARHLRAFKQSADREVGLVQQAVAPHLRRGSVRSEVAGEVTELVTSVHAALVRDAMQR